MTAWTYDYLFGQEYHEKISACLYFIEFCADPCVQKKKREDKITKLIGEKSKTKSLSSKRKNKRKSSNQNDFDFLNEQIKLVNQEKKKNTLFSKLSNIFEKNSEKRKGDAMASLKEHMELMSTLKINQVELTRYLLRYGRNGLGTSCDCNCALDMCILRTQGWHRHVSFLVRTEAQLKYIVCFFEKYFIDNDFMWSIESVDKNSTKWKLLSNVSSKERHLRVPWKISVSFYMLTGIYSNPYVVPLEIGKVMIPPTSLSVREYYQLDKISLEMNCKEGKIMILETVESLIERNLYKKERTDLCFLIDVFMDKWRDSFDKFSFAISCSKDGFFLIAGLSPLSDNESSIIYHVSRYIRKRLTGCWVGFFLERMIQFLVDIDSRDNIVHPFASVAGFGGIPQWLPVSRMSLRNIVHICT